MVTGPALEEFCILYKIDKKLNSCRVGELVRTPCRVSFQHKGLQLFYDKGNASKLQPQHVAKIRLILTRLDAAISPGEMNVPGYGLHQLSGDLAGFWAVKVDKNSGSFSGLMA